MTLPEKVRDVTQSEWLEVRERLALVESQLALATALGAEVCARLDDETAVGWGVEHARCEAMERAERAEAERDALRTRMQADIDALIARAENAENARDAMRKERDEAQRGRTSVSAVNAALRDYPDADTSALWVPASEALEYQGCWHRDVAKGRAALEKAEAERDAMRKERDEAGRDWEREHDRAAAREEQIEEAHAHTGCEREWTNLHDLGDCLARSVAEMAADLAAAAVGAGGAVVGDAREAGRWAVSKRVGVRMTERPILFSDAMVRAILAGAKTQTRRIVKDEADAIVGAFSGMTPYGKVGDRLWVRETFASFQGSSVPVTPSAATYVVLRDGTQVYRSDSAIIPPAKEYADGAFDGIKWRPSIHMPRWACRLVLEVTTVRVERLQAITEDDARDEGVDVTAPTWTPEHQIGWADGSCRDAFRWLWDSINGERAPWSSNPWVWVVSFRITR